MMIDTLFAVPGFLAPLQGFLQKFSGTTASPLHVQRARADALTRGLPAPIAAEAAGYAKPCIGAARSGVRRKMPLRVVRVMDSGQAGHSGRMMISGRMADVCAELDRMAERESALHSMSRRAREG